MELISIKCPSCGGILNVPEEKKEFFCIHCGNKYFTKDTLDNLRPNWEYKQINYDSNTGQIKLLTHPTETLRTNDEIRAKAILSLWVNNQKQIREWFTKYELEGWVLTQSLDSGCLDVGYLPPSRASRFYNFILPDFVGNCWYIKGWSVNTKRLK